MQKSERFSVKHQIGDAVIQLMTSKFYMDITVTDIVTTAQVARASFYRNFNSVNDVIDMIIDEISDEFIEDVFPTLCSNDERKWREFLFNHFYRFSMKQRQFKRILPQNMDVLFSRMDRKIQQKIPKPENKTVRNKYLPIGKMGLINAITKKWLDGGMKETPEEMIDCVMSLVTAIQP